MTETSESKKSRIRWVTLGEAIAISALILSGIGLWHEWNKRESAPVVVEKTTSIPLALRGRVRENGRELEISPIEESHALQSLELLMGKSTIELDGDGELKANDVEGVLDDQIQDGGPHRLPVRITARYVEAGQDKVVTSAYVLSYRTKDKLIGGRSLRLEGLSR